MITATKLKGAFVIEPARFGDERGSFAKVWSEAESAHGFQTLEDDTAAFYHASAVCAPGHYGGVRWDDPAFRIEWPHAEGRVIIARDREYPALEG